MRILRQPVALALLVLSGPFVAGCKPIKVTSDKSQSIDPCPSGSIEASGYCVKDGTVFLLHDFIPSQAHSGSSTNVLNFGEKTLVKGDKIYSFGRFSFGKSGAGNLQTLGFYLGNSAVGSSSSQYVGDQDHGVIISRHVLAHEVAESGDFTLSLKALNNQPAIASGSDGGLLLFRSAKLSEAIASAGKNEARAAYFVSDMIDSDKLLVPEIKPGESGPILKIAMTTLNPGDKALLRAGFSWEPATGKAAACEGVLVTFHLAAGGKKILSEGPYVVNANRPLGSAALQTFTAIDPSNASKEFSLSATMDGVNRADCVIKVLEPSTLSVVLFRTASEILSEIGNARFLHQIGSVVASSKRVASNSSGPPIETLLQFNWDHLRRDSLMTDVIIGLGSEDRVKPTRAYFQLSRAPDSLSSHLSTLNLKSPDKPRSVAILDMATENNLNTQTRFYLTAMGFNDDSKPFIVDEAQLYFLHFRRVSDQL